MKLLTRENSHMNNIFWIANVQTPFTNSCLFCSCIQYILCTCYTIKSVLLLNNCFFLTFLQIKSKQWEHESLKWSLERRVFLFLEAPQEKRIKGLKSKRDPILCHHWDTSTNSRTRNIHKLATLEAFTAQRFEIWYIIFIVFTIM